MLEITSKGEPMSFSRPVAIVILPLAGLFFERDLDEPVTGLFGPALYILYVVGVLAFGALFVGQERLSPAHQPTIDVAEFSHGLNTKAVLN